MKGDAPFSPRGPVLLLDTMWAGAGGPPNPALLARNAYIGMIETAQNVADRYSMTREEIDAFALALPATRQGRPRLGPAGQGDHAGANRGDEEDACAHVRTRRVHPRRNHGRTTRKAAGATRHHADDSGQLDATDRWRQRDRAGLGRARGGARGHAAGPRRVVGGVRPRSDHHGAGTRVGDAVGRQARRPDPRADRHLGGP